MLEGFTAGLERLVQLDSMAALLFGTVLGYLFGMIPGLQSVTAMILILPVTFGWDPIVGMYVFAGIIGSAARGGSITSIALNMPGTVQNAATALDGYPLSRQGKSSWALAAAASASMLGSLFGLVVLVITLPVAMPFVMAFGPAELFWIMVFGMVTLSFALPGSFTKGLVSIGIGIVIATIGFGGPGIYYPRFTFGSYYLTDGIPIVPAIIGLLVASEAILQLVQKVRKGNPTDPDDAEEKKRPESGSLQFSWRQGWDGFKEPLRHPWLMLRSSFIGLFVGAIPGVGGSVAQFFAYNAAYAASKSKEMFGRGSPEGLIAAEAAVDAKEGGTCIPTFIFGIPGNAEMALVLAAWQIHGLQPGIFFLRDHMDVAIALILGLLVANVIATVMQMACLPLITLIPSIRIDYVGMTVIILSVIAAFLVRQNLWDVALILVMGLMGFFLRNLGFPIIGVVIGFILGGIMERNFERALQSSLDDPAIFFASPISVFLFVATIVIIGVTVIKRSVLLRKSVGKSSIG